MRGLPTAPGTNRATYAAQARTRAEALYAGVVTPHRSCGIALAETFGVGHRPYQALRKGGITGDGPCGAIQAGVILLGELLGDPDPTGGVTPELRSAILAYRAAIAGKVTQQVDTTCNARTAGFSSFSSPERLASCVSIAGVAAETVAEVLWDLDRPAPIPPPPWEALSGA